MRWVLNMSIDGEDLTLSGRLFHSLGPTTENARSPLVFNWVHGMDSSDWSPYLMGQEVEWGMSSSEM